MANPVKQNPNATVGATTTGAGVGVAWLLGNVFHVMVSAETAVVIAGALTTVALFIGRNGIRGSIGRLWNGNQTENP